jgi:hypothetical protein
VSEADTLARAQATLERRRAELPADRLASAGAVLGALGESVSELGTPSIQMCSCGARIVLSHEAARGACDACALGGWRAERRAQLLQGIPEAFRWADIRARLVPPSPAEARAVVTEEGRLAALGWLSTGIRCLTLVGSETGTGKTTLAAAVAASWAADGLAFDWIHAIELDWSRPDHEANLRRALRAKRLVLDGIGQDLGTARGDTGMASQRAPGVQNFALEMHQGRGPGRVVLTVDLTRDELSAAYGGGVVRRIASSSNTVQVVRLTRVKRPDYVQF